MIYISLSLRYQRQLNLIAPDVIESFFTEAASAAKNNGGIVLQQSPGGVYAFESEAFCRVFSVFLTLETILQLAEDRKERIKEYLIFIDSSESQISQNTIADRMSACNNVIYSDKAVILTKEAKALLAQYANFNSIPNSNLSLYKGKKFNFAASSSFSNLKDKVSVIPFQGNKDTSLSGIISALLNTVSAISLDFTPSVFLTKNESALFEIEKKAFERFLAFRFSKVHPVYVIEGCENYLKLFFTSLSRFYAESSGRETVEIEFPEGEFSHDAIARVGHLLAEICVLRIVKDAQAKTNKISFADIPYDILEAAYLFFRSCEFLYAGEMDEFLSFLGKGKPFCQAVKSWLSSFQYPSHKQFLSCVQNLLNLNILSDNSKRRLDQYLFDYLYHKYQDGLFIPCGDFYQKLSTLGIKIPDTILVAISYSYLQPAKAAEKLERLFSFPVAAKAVLEHAEAEKHLASGDLFNAQVVGKSALEKFQRRKILYGEFEAFSFLARLLFSRADSSSGDAFSYLDYALGNAVQMKDSDAQMNALFSLASMHFLSCNFSMARSYIERLKEKATEACEKCWIFVSRFIEARIFFALGDFRSSENILLDLDSISTSLGIKKAAFLCRAWIFRAKSQTSKKMIIPDWPSDLYKVLPEAALFVLEVASKYIRIKGFEEQAEKLFLSLPSEIQDIPPERIHSSPASWEWKSSFAFTEDRYFCGLPSGTASTLYSAFYTFCSAFCEDGYVPARNAIFALAKDKMHPTNPHTYLLYYLCYELENRISGRDGPESLSYLSRAFTSMQLLAHNIGESSMKEKFFTEPYWNALLYASAKENLLI